MSIIAIIPARKGSKTVVGKNIRNFGGKPLIQWSIEVAQNCEKIDKVIVSSDDPKVFEICESLGCEYIERPSELATDTAPTLPVIQHAVKNISDSGDKIDLVVLLQPTCPLRTIDEIEEAINKFENGDFDSLISLSPTPAHFSPFWQKKISGEGTVTPFLDDKNVDDKKYTRKQDLETTYWKNGSIYIIPYETLIEKNSLFGDKVGAYVMDDEFIVNIDTEHDFIMGEFFLKYKLKNFLM